jgi:hypothetical protein
VCDGDGFFVDIKSDIVFLIHCVFRYFNSLLDRLRLRAGVAHENPKHVANTFQRGLSIHETQPYNLARIKDMNNDDNWQERIAAVIGDDTEVCTQNFIRWRDHLLKSLKLPLRVTGIEDFPWEEPYVMGGWDKKEYEKLKKVNPSYTDEFDLISILEPDNSHDLVANVRRVSDGRLFDIDLSWLETTQTSDGSRTILNDYSVWHCNY